MKTESLRTTNPLIVKNFKRSLGETTTESKDLGLSTNLLLSLILIVPMFALGGWLPLIVLGGAYGCAAVLIAPFVLFDKIKEASSKKEASPKWVMHKERSHYILESLTPNDK